MTNPVAPNRRLRIAAVIGVLAFLALPKNAAGQFEQIISATYGRPMDKVIRIIQARCACVITYEDSQYDSRHVVEGTRRDGKTEPKVWALRPSFFAFQYDLSATKAGRQEVARNIELAIAQFNASRNDGIAFRLAESANAFHVFPAQGSILRTRVSITQKDGTAHDLIRAILAGLTQQHGKYIDLAGMGMDSRRPTRLTTHEGYADDLIIGILESLSPKLSWALLFDFRLQSYALNITDSTRPPQQIVEYP